MMFGLVLVILADAIAFDVVVDSGPERCAMLPDLRTMTGVASPRVG